MPTPIAVATAIETRPRALLILLPASFCFAKRFKEARSAEGPMVEVMIFVHWRW